MAMPFPDVLQEPGARPVSAAGIPGVVQDRVQAFIWQGRVGRKEWSPTECLISFCLNRI